jgi:hypothetical protein
MRGRPSRRPRRRGVPESALLVIGLALAAHAHSLSDPDPVSSPRQNKGASAVDPVAAGALSGALGVDDSSYHLTPRPDGVTGANSMHDLDIVFTPAGLRLSAAAYELELGLVAAGREGSREVVASVTPRAERNRVVYERGSLVEWFVNGPIGVQHGFTLEAPPPGPRTSPITLDVRVGGSYRATADASAASAAFIAADGARLAYRDLIAVDAEGRRHPSHIAVVDGGVRLVVDDRDATYPIIVDPFIQTQELHGEGGYGTEFGVSVALEGDTMVVGSRIGDTNRFGQCGRGMAYVFERNGPLWQMVARLSSSRPDLCFYDGLGYAVDISGEWIAVGAPFDAHLLPDRDPASTELEDYNSSQGSVYMYKMPAGGWQDATETEWFTRFDGTDTPGNGDWDDGFGAAVRLEGDTLVIGAPAWDEYELQSGAVFVYKNPIDAGWEHVATLAPSAPAFSKMFGASLGFSNGTIVVGNVHFVFGFNSHDFVSTHAYIFEEPVDGWATTNQETAKLRMGSENAYAVAIDGDTIVLGDWRSQQALVYVKPPGGWADELPPNARLIPESLWTTGWYGFTVAVEGDTVIAATPHALAESAWEGGEAFVFKRPADGWGDDPDEPLEVFSTETLSAPGNRGGFGFAIDLDSSIVAIGEPGASHWIDETGQENPDAGSVFAFNNVTDVDPPVTTIQRTPATPLGEAGWDNAIGVTVTADDGPDGSGIHQIRCVVDLFFQGWTFDELPESPCPYVDGEFQVEGEHTLYAASVDKDGNRSAVDSLLLKLDTTDPFTNIVLDTA